MTKIVFYKRQNNIVGFESKGHAGYADAGEDIVCASISILGYTCINAIVFKYLAKADYQVKDGFISLRLKEGNEEIMEKIQVVFETILTGFESIKEEYPKYITLKCEEV